MYLLWRYVRLVSAFAFGTTVGQLGLPLISPYVVVLFVAFFAYGFASSGTERHADG